VEELKIAGIIVEYNPMHRGHVRLFRRIREELGEDTAVVCAMSGDFVQRGDLAILRRHARAEAAVRSGADMVLELPLPWALASAEAFAAGAVKILLAAGATHLAFGSESADIQALRRVAETLMSDAFPAALREELRGAVSFASARQSAVARLLGSADAAILSRPNDILGVEYMKALLRERRGTEIVLCRRSGGGHDSADLGDEPSSSAIRASISEGREREAVAAMTEPMADIYLREVSAGRAPVFINNAERAILAKLRSMRMEEFRPLCEGDEGLSRRFAAAAVRAGSLKEVLELTSTRRYPAARIRRMICWAWLGLDPGARPIRIPYLRPLAMNAVGRNLLAGLRTGGELPVLTKGADAGKLGGDAEKLMDMESHASDLFAIAYPDLRQARGGDLLRESPVVIA